MSKVPLSDLKSPNMIYGDANTASRPKRFNSGHPRESRALVSDLESDYKTPRK